MFNDSAPTENKWLKNTSAFQESKLSIAGEGAEAHWIFNHCSCPCHQARGWSRASTTETWQKAMPQVLEIPFSSPGTCLIHCTKTGSQRDPACCGLGLQMHWVQTDTDKVASWMRACRTHHAHGHCWHQKNSTTLAKGLTKIQSKHS